MKILKVVYISVLFSFFIGAQVFGRPEIWLRVYESGGSTLLATNVQIYRESTVGSGYVLLYNVDIGASSIDNGANAICDMVYSVDSDNATWPALEWESTYLIKIQDKYCKIETGFYLASGSPDIIITYVEGGGFSSVETPPNYKITMGSQGNWSSKLVTVKNNFSGGKLKIDDLEYTNVGSSGISDNYGTPTFPHTILAYDNQTPPDTYKRKFQNWTTPGEPDVNLPVEVTAPSSSTATYTANFLREFNINFENKFVGLSNTGSMEIESVQKNLPVSSYNVNEGNPISARALYQVLNGIEYTFGYWTDGTSNWYWASQTFTPNDHETYKAYFTGRPNNAYRNLHDIGAVGQKIILDWDEHPNTAVTEYKIWRKVKHNGVIGSAQLIGTRSRGNTTFTDNMYIKTYSYEEDLLWYDVRAYYSTEGTYADSSWFAVYGMSWAKKNVASVSTPLDYSVSNYPNPFNPSTNINFTIPEAANVKLTIYNMLGERVKELINRNMEAGSYTGQWNGDNEFGRKVISGVYLSVLQTNEKRIVQKMILSK